MAAPITIIEDSLYKKKYYKLKVVVNKIGNINKEFGNLRTPYNF